MGNYRFRLSDMMPNAWFYKLKDMGKAKNHNNATHHSLKKKQATTTAQQTKPKQPHNNSYPRKSYYITRELIPSDRFYNSPTTTNPKSPDPPRNSSNQRINRRRAIKSSSPKLVTSSVSAGCSCRATLCTKSDSPASLSDGSTETEFCKSFPPEFRSDRVLTTESFDNMVSWSSSCSCKVVNSNANDIVINVDNKSITTTEFDKLDKFDSIAELELPPIITKPPKFKDMVNDVKKKDCIKEPSNKHKNSLHVKVVKEEHKNSHVRRLSVSSPGVRLRINSPRIANRRIQGHGRKSVSSSTSSLSSRRSLSVDSLAIVKSSFDPQRDFRESMVEMIMENNIRASKDLEDLLACYLSLNSDQYHDLIINVFKQIWFDLTDIRLK